MSRYGASRRRGISFEWDTEKARRNKRNHGVTFEQAIDAFFDQGAIILDDLLTDDGEERFHLIGLTEAATLLLVVHSYRNPHGETSIRIISARRTTPSERELYRDANP